MLSYMALCKNVKNRWKDSIICVSCDHFQVDYELIQRVFVGQLSVCLFSSSPTLELNRMLYNVLSIFKDNLVFILKLNL